MAGIRVVVIGASAGGVQALCSVVESLPANLPAAVLIVLHLAPHSHSALPAILGRSSCLPAAHPSEGEAIEPGRIYIAPPDRHLAVRDGRIHLSRNASENGHRPAVDVLIPAALENQITMENASPATWTTAPPASPPSRSAAA